MKPFTEEDIIRERKKISLLIFNVLAKKIPVREALLAISREIEDESIECAISALIHYESDEELQEKDIEYKEQQVETLEFIGFLFEEGTRLPDDMINDYKSFYKDAPPKVYRNDFKSVMKMIFDFLNIRGID